MIRDELVNLIFDAVDAAFPGQKVVGFGLMHPEKEEHGDYATNVAMTMAKELRLAPLVIAEKIAQAMPAHDAVASAHAVAPGFINLSLRPEFLWSQVQRVMAEGDGYGRSDVYADKKIMFEFGCPNTHKMPHIGHLFSYCYGESAVRLLEATGHQTFRDNYQGDVGLHVAKCLWAYEQDPQEPAELADKVQYLQLCYQKGSLAYDEDPAAKEAIDRLNTKIYQKDPSILLTWEKTRQWSVDYYAQFEERIGSHFERHYFESETSEIGTALIEQNTGKIFEEDQGAIIFRGENYGLHTRVFINQRGNPTYEAKDVGLIAKKLAEGFDFDKAIYTTAHEQNDYMKVVFKAFELIYPQLAGKLEHIGFGMINLTTGKMSSRTGALSAVSLIELVKDRVRAYIRESRDYTEAETEEIAEIVAIGAVKYSFLRVAPIKNITFDLETSVAFDGNSGPYLQYTYARCRSVLRKANEAQVTRDETFLPDFASLNTDEQSVLRWLYRFDEVVVDGARQRAPHLVASFAFELAQRYSLLYNNNQILADDAAVAQRRLALTAVVAQTLKNALYLLGIEVAEKI